MFKWRNISLRACTIGLLALTSVMMLGGKGGGGGTGDGSGPPGKIYYLFDSAMYTMNGDGSNKQVVPGLDPVVGDPSYALHGGQRWFLVLRALPGTDPHEDYPDWDVIARYELYAVSSFGGTQVEVQLTDDFGLRPDPSGGRAHWLPGDEGISFGAVEWEQDVDTKEWSPVAAGIYALAVNYGEDGRPLSASVSTATAELCVPTEWVPWNSTTVPAIDWHDWNAAGTAVLCGFSGEGNVPAGLWVAPLANPTALVPLGPGSGGFWSPDGSKIAFWGAEPDGIYVMNADGSNRRLLRARAYMMGLNLNGWSPDSQYLLCREYTVTKANGGPWVCRLSLSGQWVTLTPIKSQASGIGWR